MIWIALLWITPAPWMVLFILADLIEEAAAHRAKKGEGK